MKSLFVFFVFILLFACLGCVERGGTTEKERSWGPGNSTRPDGGGQPGGNEPARLPSCSDLCPRDESILRGRNGNFSYLSFPNFGYRGIGRCRGHVLVSQRFVQLAHFEMSSNCLKEVLDDACVEEARHGIEKIMGYEAVTIKGFGNLFDFSSHPQVREMLKVEVRSISHRFRAFKALIEEPVGETWEENVFYETLRRVKLNHTPYLAIHGENVGHHALMAYGEKKYLGRRAICVRDPNIIASANLGERCSHFLILDGAGGVKYRRQGHAFEKLDIFDMYSDEDERIELYVSARQKQCVDRALSQNSCSN